MAELERQMTLFETRLRNIEARLNISSPERPQYGSNHQGTKTKEVLIQEGFSLKNSYKPQTMMKSEIAKWTEAYTKWVDEISGFDEKVINEIHVTIEKMLHPEHH